MQALDDNVVQARDVVTISERDIPLSDPLGIKSSALQVSPMPIAGEVC